MSRKINHETNEKKSFHFYIAIKVLTSFYKFQRDLLYKIESENVKGKNLILLNKTWFSNYKKFYLYEELIKLINEYNLSEFDYEEQKIIFNNLFKTFSERNNIGKMIIFYGKKEFPEIINYKKVNFLEDFEIINKEIYENLQKHKGDFNISPNDNNKFSEYICYNGKLIIKYINEELFCYNILIGHLSKIDNINNNFYIPEIFVNFQKKEKLEDEFNNVNEPTSNILKKYINEQLPDNIIDINNKLQEERINSFNYNKVKYIINKENFGDNKAIITNNPSNKGNLRIDSEKIINFLINLYRNYEDIKEKINNEQYSKDEFDYILMNKNWIDKFKEAYKYSEIKNYKNIHNQNFSKIKDRIDVINKTNDDLIYDLSNINLKYIDYDYCETVNSQKDFDLKIYKNFELWSIETYKSFLDIGFKLDDRRKNVKCYFDKTYIFIVNNNDSNFLNIYQLIEAENYFNPIMVIKHKDIKEIIEKIKKGTIFKFIYSLNQENGVFLINKGEGVAYLLNNHKGKIMYKIEKKSKRIDFVINLLIYNEEIKRKTHKPIKENLKQNNNSKEEFYLVHEFIIDDYLKKTGLYNIYTNPENSRILQNYNNMNIEKMKYNLRKYITLNNEFSEQIELTSNASAISDLITKNKSTNIDYITVRNNTEKIFYYNNYYLINEETLDIINDKYKNLLSKFNCLIGQEKILFISNSAHKNIIQIGYLNKKGIFKIEAIIDIFNNYDKIEDKIINIGYHQFFQKYFIFQNSQDDFANISPLFDEKFKIQGYGYKIKNNALNKIINFSDFNYNNILLKVIYLIIYFMNYKKILFKNEDEKYYLINKNWIEAFMDHYSYEKVLNEIQNNRNIVPFLKNINGNIIKKNEEKNSKEIDIYLLSKQIYLLIKFISKTNKLFNDNQKNLDNINFPTEDPLLEVYPNDLNLNFTIYNNFFLIDKNIFDQIFDIKKDYAQTMEFKNYYCDCFYIEEFIFIKLNKNITTLDKIVFEIGIIDDLNKLFILQYLIIYNNEEDFQEHFKYLKQKGIQNFFNEFQFNSESVKPLQINDKSWAYICKYGQVVNNNTFNNTKNSININADNISNRPERFPDNYIPIRKKFTDPPMIGLQNVGATCYMNATIQCFGQIEKLVDHFKSYSRINKIIENYNKKGENCLANSFKYLIENLWPTNDKYYNKKYNLKNSNNKYFVPREFKEKISKMNPLFEGARANDSKDLVNFIIMRLHEELNEGTKYENNISPSQEDEMAIFNYFKESYYHENKSIISDLFYGINGTVYQCSKCGIKKFNFQVGFFYIFPLEEVRKYKIQNLQNNCMQKMQIGNIFPAYMNMDNNMNMNMNLILCNPFFANIQNINSVTIYDCFDYNQKIETMSGENSMYCSRCGSQESAFYQSYIVNSPEIIIIILNRGKGIEFNVKLEFNEILDIQKYVKNNSPSQYKLIGVVTHLGESGASGHFIAYCLSPINNKWYNYNDDLCFPVTNFKEQVIDYAMPYILFYQKI